MTRRSPEIKPRVAHLEGQRQASSSFFRGSSGLLNFGGDAEPSSAGSSFAVHRLSDPQFPDRAALVLGRDPNSSDDGLLVDRHSRAGGNPFEEITQLSLSADLVTLSACDTANGKLEGEEGIDGLAEAFVLAGAKSVVGALWEVDDSATGSLMKAFNSHLAQGQDKAYAIRQAKLDYLQRSANSSPVYWAPFTLIGDGSAPIVF